MKFREGGDSRRDGGARMWRLMRQDDSGNRYPVAVFPTRDEADHTRKQYEAHGHKQIYWVEAPGAADCS